MPRDAVSRTANVERTDRHKWVKRLVCFVFQRIYGLRLRWLKELIFSTVLSWLEYLHEGSTTLRDPCSRKSFVNLLRYCNPLMPNGAFNICCPRDCVSRHNGGTSGAPLKPLRVDSALKALPTLRGLRGAPEVPPLCRETQSLGQQMLKGPLGINGLNKVLYRIRPPRSSGTVTLH